MKRLLTISALLVLTASAAFAASPAGKGPANGQVQASKSTNSAKACKTERGTTASSVDAFNQKYGTNKNKKNAFGKCVSAKSKLKVKADAPKAEDDEIEADDEKAEETEAAEDEKADDADHEKAEAAAVEKCKAERGTTAPSIAAFNEKYGTNKNKKNAFGKCVSKNAKPARP
jgi:ABC-type microcin C transport system permease subunit YejB